MTRLKSHGGALAGELYPEAFSKIFGFKATYGSFLDAHEASLDHGVFVDNETGFWKYKEAIGNSLASPTAFEHFQHDDFFHFVSAHRIAPAGSDSDEEIAARSLNAEIAAALFAIGDSSVGYLPGTLQPGDKTRNTLRHVLMLTLLMNRIGDLSNCEVVEIGGGFGNFVRLIGQYTGFRTWTILDLPFVSDLQAWYLGRTLPTFSVSRNNVDAPIRCIDTEHKNEFALAFQGADVLIATHSWSELPYDKFLWYLHNILPRCRYLLYATQREWPSKELVDRKVELICKQMRPIADVGTEGGEVINVVFERT